MATEFDAAVASLQRKLANAFGELQSIVDYSRKAIQDPTTVAAFKGIFRTLQKYFDKYESTYEELVDRYHAAAKSTEFPSKKDSEQFANAKRYYKSTLMNYEIVTKKEADEAAAIAASHIPAPVINPGNVTTSSESRNSNLPRISLPKFDGQYTAWPKFRDMFVSLVDKDDTLSRMEKFHYLSSSLSGNASAVISHLALEEGNYALAWQALLDTFDKKRLLANSYLNHVLQFKANQGKPNSKDLLRYLSSVTDSISALKLLNINDLSEFVLFFLAFKNLDSYTKEQFEFANKNVDFPTFANLVKFVREKCVALQLSEGIPEFDNPYNSPPNKVRDFHNKGKSFKYNSHQSKPKATLLTGEEKGDTKSPSSICPICDDSRTVLNCSNFYILTPQERSNKLRNWQGCKNCLSTLHITSKCRSKWHCRFCPQRHNSLLHLFSKDSSNQSTTNDCKSAPNSSRSSNAQSSVQFHHVSTCPKSSKVHVILGTALANFIDVRGQVQQFRIAIDSGSQQSFITTRCVNKLGLNILRCERKISSLGGSLFDGTKGKTVCVIRSKDLSNVFTTDAVIVSNITNHLPTSPLPRDIWRHFIGFELADPKFWEPSSIDFLLGADLYGDVMNGKMTTVRDNLPKLFDSAFGHIVMGRYAETNSSTNLLSSVCLFSSNSQNDNLNFELSKFWELEEPTSHIRTENPEHVEAERFFTNTHFRLEDGRYVVRLPLKDSTVQFPTSDAIARRRFENLESKLKRNPSLSVEYHNFIDEYIQLGHMKKTLEISKFVIPHHCVSKEDRGELKLRVVFDGSIKTRNGSLNDSLLIGPPLQTDIRDILLNFRRHAIVFVADAVKMYRQILVHPDDRAYQHILWRSNSSDAIQTYELCTVTYGLSCAPFLALRTLQQLVEDEKTSFPLAAHVLSSDIFVDDLVTGAPTISKALKLQHEIIGLMHRGGFALSKWASNHPAILTTVSDGSSNAENNTSVTWSDSENGAIKVLGLKWDPVSDSFSYQMKPPASNYVSKRSILSTVARIFDPLGFIAPCTFLMKGFVQELWKLKLGWDDPVPNGLATDWNDIVQQLELMSFIQIPRFVISHESFEHQIIGFADASQKGYCAALYIRVITAFGIKSHLLTSKTKLAPIKSISIPRLELCGALLLAKLYKSIHGFEANLPPSTHPSRFFSDSTIVLSWLKIPTYRLKTFVANRVGQIAELTDLTSWNHVDSKNNPSDIGSRGSLPTELPNNSLWWSGPSWLSLLENEWPYYTSKIDEELPELRPISNSVLITIKPGSQEFLNWMSRVSSYSKLIRVAAILLRAMHNRKNKQSLRSGILKLTELQDAELICIKMIQRHHFFKGSTPSKSHLESRFPALNAFIDESGVSRVGGRLSNSSIPENRKYPILLPNKSHFTNLLVDHYHTVFLHPGPNLNQALLQTKFWIPASRRLIRQRLFLCLKCYKAKAKSIPPLMGNLPTYRLEGGRAFLHTGIDFAGPFITRESRRRKAPLSKSYLCLYVCMTTKALHLETVSDLSTQCFLASFSRFISRRGLPSEIYSDCGSNFKGACKELERLSQWLNDEQTQTEIEMASSIRGINWNFNPPYSPHFGGLWEAGVKAVKRHLYHAAGNVPLTFEEIDTLFCRIEAILNSRPLCPLSPDPSEFDFLSPGHFLVGGPLTVNPEPTLLDVVDNRLDRWQLVKKMTDQVCQRWHLEYIFTLQARSKWRKPSANLEVGDLVLIKDPSSPQLDWPTARVSNIHPGSDGIFRVVTLRTRSSTYTRSVVNLVPLLPLKTPAHPSDP